MKVKKAVIPAAGLGTRVLPASKAVPKEMLPIVDKPAIQYIVEEAAAAGIEDILIITGRGKGAIEDHFDRSPELEAKLLSSGKEEMQRQMAAISHLANLTFLRQQETKGLGHAILCARQFAGDEPFAVLYGDDVVLGPVSATRELCAAYEEYGLGVVGIQPVQLSEIGRYCTLAVKELADGRFAVSDMIEKPKPEQVLSPYAILGRCLLTPEIFPILENTPPGAGGELQLTDAMRTLARTKGMIGVQYSSKRYDMGNKLGILQATVEVAAAHPEVGPQFLAYLKEFLQNRL